ncbi:MAG: leucine-rich repeat protein [Rikenellaceae bacterium]
MKRLLLNGTVLLSTALLVVGCSQDNLTLGYTPESSNAITFVPNVSLATKGLITGNLSDGEGYVAIENNGFGIVGYNTGSASWVGNSETANVMYNTQVSSIDGVWSYSPLKYWESGCNYSFFAYAPFAAAGVNLSDISQVGAPTVAFALQSDPVDMVDFVASQHYNLTSGTVAFNLKHELSRIAFSGQTSFDGNQTANVTITALKILVDESPAFFNTATYKFAQVSEGDGVIGTWADLYNSLTEDYDLTSLLGEGGSVIPNSSAAETAKTALLSDNHYLFLLPPAGDTGVLADNSIKFEVSYVITDGDATSANTATFSLNEGSLKQGKAYDFLLTFSSNFELSATAIVVPWDDENNTIIPDNTDPTPDEPYHKPVDGYFDLDEYTNDADGKSEFISDLQAAEAAGVEYYYIYGTYSTNDKILGSGNSIKDYLTDTNKEYVLDASKVITGEKNASVANLFVGMPFTKIIVPEGSYMIGQTAFGGCVNLTTIEGLENVNEIMQNAFPGCPKLTTLRLTCSDKMEVSVDAFRATYSSYDQSFLTTECTLYLHANQYENITLSDAGTLVGAKWEGKTWKEIIIVDDSGDEVIVNDPMHGSIDLDSYSDRATLLADMQEAVAAGVTDFTLVGTYTNNLLGFDTGENLFNSITLLSNQPLAIDMSAVEGITFISDNAFKLVNTIESIVLPDGVTHIGNEAFTSTSVLKSVSAANVTYVSGEAFDAATALEVVDLPKAVYLGFETFRGCTSLVDISLPSATTLGTNIFYGCSKLKSVNIPLAEKLENSSFNLCSSLETVSAPQVKSVGSYAFGNCSALTSIDLPSATTLGSAAFDRCSKLVDVNLPLVTDFDNYAFSSCTALVKVVITSNEQFAFGGFVFAGCTTTNCTLYLASRRVTEIILNSGSLVGATWGSYTWKEIILVNEDGTLVEDGSGATSDSNLINLADAVDATALTASIQALVDKGVTPIKLSGANTSDILGIATPAGSNVFKSITLNNGEALSVDMSGVTDITEIGAIAFKELTTIKELILPSGVTSIGDSSFLGCTALEVISLPSVTSVGNYAFNNCYTNPTVSTNLKTIKLTTAGDITFGVYVFNFVPTSQVDLVLNSDKQTELGSSLTFGGYTWKSIAFE